MCSFTILQVEKWKTVANALFFFSFFLTFLFQSFLTINSSTMIAQELMLLSAG